MEGALEISLQNPGEADGEGPPQVLMRETGSMVPEHGFNSKKSAQQYAVGNQHQARPWRPTYLEGHPMCPDPKTNTPPQQHVVI